MQPIRLFFLIFLTWSLGASEREISNQTQQDLSNMPSVKRHEAGIVKVPIVIATEESLQGFGHIVRDYEKEDVIIVTWPAPSWRPVVTETGRGGGIVEDSFTMRRKGNLLFAENNAVERRYITGWYDDPAQADEQAEFSHSNHIYTHEANYHPDGGQVFFPLDEKPFIALLAKPGDDITPDDFIAFYCDGTFGIQILPNVWHQPMFPVGDNATFMNKQGAVHACIGVDFIAEFGVYLAIPLN